MVRIAIGLSSNLRVYEAESYQFAENGLIYLFKVKNGVDRYEKLTIKPNAHIEIYEGITVEPFVPNTKPDLW